MSRFQFSLVQSLSCVWLFVTSWTAARQPFLSFTIFWSLLKLMYIDVHDEMPSNHLVLSCPLLLLLSVFPSINELALCIRWPKYWSFSFSVSPSSVYSGLISLELTGLISLQSKGLSTIFSGTTVQSIHSLVLSLLYHPAVTSICDYWFRWDNTWENHWSSLTKNKREIPNGVITSSKYIGFSTDFGLCI